MEQWQVDLFERITRIEANQEYMKSSLHDLPQSKQCEKELKELKGQVTELEKFKDAIQRKVAYIGGVIVVIGLFVPYAIEWVVAHIQLKLG
jgi:lipid II:glycine glycyltransferase (peptidoglycan interpeptide bridge formation enzyme)